jgi:hypothetical protein
VNIPRRKSELLRELVGCLEANGATGIDIWRGGKHWRVRFNHSGRTLTATCAVSPSDYRAQLKARAQIKRVLRGQVPGAT